MLSSIKQLTRHSAIYGIGHIASRAIGFLLLPIHTNFIVPEQYGAAALLFSALAILTVFFSYGMDVAFLRYFIMADSREEKKRIFSTSFLMLAGSGLLFSGLMFLFPGPVSRAIFADPEYITLVRLGSGILFADTLCLIPYLLLRAQERSRHFVLIKLCNVLLNVGLNVLFVIYMGAGVKGIFVSNIIASVTALILLLPVAVQFFDLVFDGSVLKRLLQFGLPYIPSGVAVLVMDQIGRFFLDRLAGKSAAGIFSANCKLGIFMALVVAAFRFAWHPFFLRTAKENEEAPKIFARVLTYFTGIAAQFFLLITFMLDEIISFHIGNIYLFGRGFSSGKAIVPVILLAYILYGLYVNFIIGIYIRKKTPWLMLITMAGAITGIGMNLALVPDMGIMGAALATLSAYAVMAVIIFFVNRLLYPIPYEGIRLLKIVVCTGIVYAGGTWLFVLPGTGLLTIAVFPALLFVTGFFNEGEKRAVKTAVKRILSL